MKNPSVYLKMRVLGAIDFALGKSIAERIKKVAETIFVDEQGIPRKFTWRTIQTWYSRYKKDGISTLNTKPRKDKGKRRKVSPEEIDEAIRQVLPLFTTQHHYNKMAIYRKCIEKGLIRPEQCARTTFFRFIREYELLKTGEITNKQRLAFSKQYANQLWQGDTMAGPYVSDGDKKKPAYLLAFIDDASRVVPHGEFFFQENTAALINTFKNAFYKRGIPDVIYVDNGPIYTCKEIILICARVGTILQHAPLSDAAAKGKIERFFHTVRQCFLCQNLDLSSLTALNRQFHLWLEEEYNSKVHSAIGMKPIDRFNLDYKRIRFLPPNEATEELFFFEEERTVKKDNTFSLKNIRYEAPRDLRGRNIQIRYNRYHISRVIVYYKNERMGEALPLNPFLNDRSQQKGE